MADIIDRVGMGVDLDGGADVITTLRAIRTEMTAINQLAGGTIKSPSRTTSGKSIKEQVDERLRAADVQEKELTAIADRGAKARLLITQEEVNVNIAEARREARLTEAIHEESANKETEIIRKSTAEQAKIRKASIPISTQEINAGVAAKERAEELKFAVTEKYNKKLTAAERKLTKQLEDEERARTSTVEYQMELRKKRLSELGLNTPEYRERVSNEIIARASNPNAPDQILDPSSPFGIKQRRILQEARNDPAAANDPTTQMFRNQIARRIVAYRKFKRDETDQISLIDREEQARLGREHDALIAEANARNAINVKTLQGPDVLDSDAALRDLYRKQRSLSTALQKYRTDYNLYGKFTGATPKFYGGGSQGPIPVPPPPPPPPPDNLFAGGGNRGPINTRGFFTTADAVGRITRNILLYEVISRATYGLAGYVKESVNAAKATVEMSNALRFATEQSNGNLAANEKLADSLSQIGLSRQQGRKAVTEAARFAETRPRDTAALTQVVADIAAERGGGIDKTDELIEQLRRRESKFYKRIFGKTVESIYEDTAREAIQARTSSPLTTPNLYIGTQKQDIKSQSDQIKEYVANMDDAAKEQAVFNYILSQGSKFQGEAAERANTLAGRLDKMNAAWLNAQEGVGLFITQIKPLNDLFDALSKKAGILDALRPPTLQRSGPGNTVTEADIQKFGIESGYSKQAGTLRSVNENLVPVVGTAATIGITALLGRGKATETAKLAEYYRQLEISTAKYGGDLSAAVTEASNLAKNAKPGLIRSSFAGLQRITYGLTQSLADTITGYETQIGKGKAGPLNVPFGATQAEFQALKQQATRSPSGLQVGGGIIGGITGGILGAELGSLVADKLQVGPITATALTITGGIAGTAIGTAIGDVAGKAIAAALGIGTGAAAAGEVATGVIGKAVGFGKSVISGVPEAAASISVGAGISASVLVPLAVATYIGTAEYQRSVAQATDAINAETKAYSVKVKQDQLASQEGRVQYRNRLTGQLLSEQEYANVPNRDIQRVDRNIDLTGGSFFSSIAKFLGIGTGTGSSPGYSPLGALSRIGQGDTTTTTSEFIDKNFEKIVNATAPVPKTIADVDKALSELRVNIGRQSDIDIAGTFTNAAPFSGKGADIGSQIATQTDIENQRTLLDLQDQIAERRKRISVLNESPTVNSDEIKKETAALGGLTAQQERFLKLQHDRANLSRYGTTDPIQLQQKEKIAQEMAQHDLEFQQKQDKDRQERINQMGNALSKLRDAAAGSFRVVGDIANQIAGPDNPYTQVLTNQITAAERMTQQWGFLGKAAVDYFTKLEQTSVSRQLNKLDFGTYAQVSNLRNQSARETLERNVAPGLSRRDEDQLGIVQALVNRSTGNIGLQQQLDRVTRRAPFDFEREFINSLNKIRDAISPGTVVGGVPVLGAFSQLSPEAQLRARGQVADAELQRLDTLTPKQIDNFRLRGRYVSDINVQRQLLDQQVTEAQRKASYGQAQDDLLSKQLRADEQFRQSQLAKGYDVSDVGREADKLLLSRTEGINPKDLTYDQFRDRQDALRREAERTAKDQEEAKKAVLKGLEYQDSMNKELQIIREAILGGDVSMLVQVQNDTQARIDAEALEAAGTNVPFVPNVPVKNSPTRSDQYTSPFGKYSRR